MILSPIRTYSLSGMWSVSAGDGKNANMRIPGTLAESNVGRTDDLSDDEEFRSLTGNAPDPLDRMLDDEEDFLFEQEEPDAADGEDTSIKRLTRKYSYEGSVRISRMLSFREKPGKRVFLEIERARALEVYVNGERIRPFRMPCLTTEQCYELTGHLNGESMLTVVSDNRYPEMPEEQLKASNMAFDETQTNWNGLLGYVRLREEDNTFISRVCVIASGTSASVRVEISAKEETDAEIRLSSPALKKEYTERIRVADRVRQFRFEGLELSDNVMNQEEGESHLYAFSVFLNGVEKKTFFGVRSFGFGDNGRAFLNRHAFFVRGALNRGVFPETSHMPMDRGSWKEILGHYRDYGINVIFFESCCPPEEGFTAADELGMFFVPELSIGSSGQAFATEAERLYYENELKQILYSYGNHPSFIMLSLGRGLTLSDEGENFIKYLAETALKQDGTRYYLFDDKVISPALQEDRMPVIRKIEATRELLPDFREIDLFSGEIVPDYLMRMRDLAAEKGILANWNRYVELSGREAAESYRQQTELALADPKCTGFIMTGIQDYTGDGGHFTGLLNAHLQTKPFEFAQPGGLLKNLKTCEPVLYTAAHAYEHGDVAAFRICAVNFGKESAELKAVWRFRGGETELSGELPPKECPPGCLTRIGTVNIGLSGDGGDDRISRRYQFILKLGKSEIVRTITAYPAVLPICPTDVLEFDELNDTAMEFLRNGGTVFLTPPGTEEYLPGSVSAAEQRGQLNDLSHTIFDGIFTEEYADDFWEHLKESRAVVLPRPMKVIAAAYDNPVSDRPLGKLFEFRCGGGNVFFSSLGLKEHMDDPEVRFLLDRIYRYLGSYDFSPAQELKPEELKKMVIVQ